MRNIFDQYTQPENKLTHALISTLANDRSLIRPFLRWLGVRPLPQLKNLQLTEQQVPGEPVPAEEGESKGLPDGCIYDETNQTAVLFEAKVGSHVGVGQLRRHLRTAERYGYNVTALIVIDVDGAVGGLPDGCIATTWREIYAWFRSNASESFWARTYTSYVEKFEADMIARDYAIRGTLTMFDGLRFDDDNPYTYREAKRLLKLMGDALQTRKDLLALGVDPQGERRPTISGRAAELVWDFLPMIGARGRSSFTAHPHLTLGITGKHAEAALTIPNGIAGGFRTRLKNLGRDGFDELLKTIAANLDRVLKKSPASTPLALLLQRHFKSQRSSGAVDGRMHFDLRTLRRVKGSRVKYQPQWSWLAYELLTNKRSNLQFQITMQFNYNCPRVRSVEVLDLYAESWKAMTPMLEFAAE